MLEGLGPASVDADPLVSLLTIVKVDDEEDVNASAAGAVDDVDVGVGGGDEAIGIDDREMVGGAMVGRPLVPVLGAVMFGVVLVMAMAAAGLNPSEIMAAAAKS